MILTASATGALPSVSSTMTRDRDGLCRAASIKTATLPQRTLPGSLVRSPGRVSFRYRHVTEEPVPQEVADPCCFKPPPAKLHVPLQNQKLTKPPTIGCSSHRLSSAPDRIRYMRPNGRRIVPHEYASETLRKSVDVITANPMTNRKTSYWMQESRVRTASASRLMAPLQKPTISFCRIARIDNIATTA